MLLCILHSWSHLCLALNNDAQIMDFLMMIVHDQLRQECQMDRRKDYHGKEEF